MRDIKVMEKTSAKIRKRILDMIYRAQSGHIGGSFSCVEALVCLYFDQIRLNSNEGYRDMFILSKGHAAPALYAVLCEKGFLPEEELNNLRKLGSMCQGHPDMHKNEFIDASTGSLGQGLSVAAGIALGAKMKKRDMFIYVLLGDGELNEGQNYEAMMFCAHNKLDNLIAMVDNNKFQLDGPTEEIMPVQPIEEKFRAFNWNVLQVDGHKVSQILEAIDCMKKQEGKPGVIILNTVKGKGISFMENQVKYHGTPPNDEEYEIAIEELRAGGYE